MKIQSKMMKSDGKDAKDAESPRRETPLGRDKTNENKDGILHMSLDVASIHLQDQKVNMNLSGESLGNSYDNLDKINASYDPSMPYQEPRAPPRLCWCSSPTNVMKQVTGELK